MKKLTYAIVALCSTVLVCTRKDTGEADLWVRSIEPRLSTAREWRPCRKLNGSPRQVVTTAQCGNAQPRVEAIRQKACDVLIRNREEALHVLVSQPQCIDTVIPRLETFSPPDLAAAYYYRAQVMDRASDLLRALESAQNAVNMNDNLPVSLFNQALAQEALGLRADAVESWTRFLELERQSEWADEARARRGALLAAPVMRRSRSARASVVATEPLEGANGL
ncbi:MAG TPA: tetratricopeptide repeat protein, partial [Thermoanaerobaculia bacterium]|nr:tetratricopeptide repeat protein [Thermoanaerobaculia bacterium]